jgi:putative ABC transport system substrate-binding protein
MRRRDFLVSFPIGAIVYLLRGKFAHAQGTTARVRRLGILASARSGSGLEAELKALGWVEGENLHIESRLSGGDTLSFPTLAAELVAAGVDVIVAGAPPAVRAAREATRTIPVVMMAVADPVRLGFVQSLAHPGGNITGVASNAGPTPIAKLLETTREALPGMQRIGLLYNAGNPLNYAAAFATELDSAAAALEITLLRLPIHDAGHLESKMQEAARERVDAVLGVGDPLIFAHRARVHDLAERLGLATVWSTREYLADRGLLSHGPSLDQMARLAAGYVDKILRGARPADLPVVQPTTYYLTINLRRARSLGVQVPDSLIARADEVIE